MSEEDNMQSKYVVITKGYYKGCMGDIVKVTNGIYTVETYAGVLKFRESEFHYYDLSKGRIIKKKIEIDLDNITSQMNKLPLESIIPLKRKLSMTEFLEEPMKNLSFT
ncbi:MAG: hypothetical protein EHM20_11795 [Alphaproteobacteria bacterium]|nr:MAG: hypothetical protein EHM20_11795 [Alphaproteobacteria bacterium]